jgi:hypothetical protein
VHVEARERAPASRARKPRLDLVERGALAELVVLSDDLAEGLIRDPGAVARHRPTRFTGGDPRCEDVPELADERRLPDTRLARRGHEVRLGLRRDAAICRAQEFELALSAHEYPPQPGHSPRAHRPEGSSHRHALDPFRLALAVDGPRVAELEGAGRRRGRALPDEHLAGMRSFLETICDVHRVAP